MSASLPPGYRRVADHDVMPTTLADVCVPRSAEERAGMATAYALRDVHRGIRRVVARLDAMAAREAARRSRR
jgi:hypothetical protein